MAEQPQSSPTQQQDPVSTLVDRLSSLSVAKQISLLVSIAAVVALTVALFLWTGKPDYSVLFGSADPQETQEVISFLEKNQVAYKLDDKTGAVLVPKEDVYNLRLQLAAAGLPKSAPTGYQILDQEQGFGISQFREITQYKRALEGELAKTIESIDAIRTAKVILGLPKRSVFVRKQQEPTASVVVRLRPGRQLSDEQVNAIVYLIASSVPNLKPKNVTVVDQHGNLLSDNQQSEMRISLKRLDYTRNVEETLSTRIVDVLSPIVGGAHRVRAQVTAELDFTQRETTQESYEPDPMAVRSEQLIKELEGQKGPQGIPGALTNQPPRAGIAPEEGYTGAQGDENLKRFKEKTTRNYELDRTISHIKSEVGTLRRLSVAVVIDDKTQVDPETGEIKKIPWSEEELERFKKLVSDAVALNAARGDSLSVVNASFVKTAAEEEEFPFWKEPWFFDLVKQVLAVLAILLVFFGIIRPMIKDLTKPDEALVLEYPKEVEAEEEVEAAESIEEIHKALDQMNESVEQAVAEVAAGGSAEEQETFEKVKNIVQNDPKTAAHVLKKWLQEG